MSNFKKEIDEHKNLLENLASHEEIINNAIRLIASSINNSGKLILIGNGGSAADAQHLAAEFIGRFINDRPALPAIALTVDSSVLTCISNDYGYDYVFQRQVEGLGKPGDTLLAISTSGNSQSIINAIKAANSLGIKTISFLGKDGGKAKGMSDYEIVIDSYITARIQEMHIFIGHFICGEVEKMINKI